MKKFKMREIERGLINNLLPFFFAGAKLNLTALEDGECTADFRGN